MALVTNVGRTERIIRISAGIVAILLFTPLGGAAQWVSLGLGVFFLATGVMNY